VAGDPVNFIDPSGRFLIVAVVPAAGAWAAWAVYQALNDAYKQADRDAINTFSKKDLHNGPGDAYKHCLASCLGANAAGKAAAAAGGWYNEARREPNPPDEELMDHYNNACGRSYSGDSDGECYSRCANAAFNGPLEWR
jgi:hypothetical protein